MSTRRHGLDDLLSLMAVLRDPLEGCPWDVRQDWDSIVPHTLEEAYEVADAIERRAFDELPGELGDLLFQVVYYSRFAEEEGRFDFHDVVDTLTAKMLARHPHVFPDGTLASRREGVSAAEVETRQVKSNWEALKADERHARAATSVLDDVPRNLPALSRAAKLTKRAARVGFDWPDERGVIAKIREELDEVEQALAEGDVDHAGEEVGDLLFAVVNLARRLGSDPERALRGTNAKFERRFQYVERALADQQRRPEDVSLAEMDRHWDAAKRHERNPSKESLNE
ncbi:MULTISPECIES: nucleoside triphosphate pyrophosphohydrolase [unclassified Modicisalibacter]|uniref:nucleoside triphosphate pyrophosphohydrolase n=1 Tax=unclassified Modicisalibacter TaxID=2679913 RepID=UPI001CCB31EB|nr:MULTISPECIES: nucleoside triphosphate pyrophosphohydrolase [unclassified Modicisalibacter]MBZ9556600.1 nucleoside triphosphate pyrophosphohydrolase [Modicisalibacter sp. R2A 31.J]MBZ9574931.1 nucleoside triphosphate pyrophosphohydrolase [Modicisalibacter sp. MOD 31.J]